MGKDRSRHIVKIYELIDELMPTLIVDHERLEKRPGIIVRPGHKITDLMLAEQPLHAGEPVLAGAAALFFSVDVRMGEAYEFSWGLWCCPHWVPFLPQQPAGANGRRQ